MLPCSGSASAPSETEPPSDLLLSSEVSSSSSSPPEVVPLSSSSPRSAQEPLSSSSSGSISLASSSLSIAARCAATAPLGGRSVCSRNTKSAFLCNPPKIPLKACGALSSDPYLHLRRGASRRHVWATYPNIAHAYQFHRSFCLALRSLWLSFARS